MSYHPVYNNFDCNDPAGWVSACTAKTAVDAIEPLELSAAEYREHAQNYLEKLLVIDDFVASSPDPRFAWVSTAILFRLPSTHGCDPANLARQMGCRTAPLLASVAALRARLA